MSDSITVHSLICYLTEVEGVTWRGQDHTANKIVHVAKGDPINGYFEVKVRGKTRRITQSNCDKFVPLLIKVLSAKIAETVDGDFAIVPIPNSSVTIANRDAFRTLDYAQNIASTIGPRAIAIPAIRWKEEKLSARKGGSRDPQVHFENLHVVQKPSRPVVVFDDVITSGSQMIAACRRLEKVGVQLICGFVVGRAVKIQKDRMIRWTEEHVSLEENPIDWTGLVDLSTRR
jgi:hypothetical protein